MTKRPIRYFQITLLLTAFLLALSVLPGGAVTATQDDSATESNFSEMNWDEEDTEEESTDGVDGNNLLSESWEDEEGDEIADSEDDLQTLKQEDIDKLESQERRIHIAGFFLFIGYIIGGVLTAFYTRNRRIAVSWPPELLILLHSLWPIELLLVPFFGKTVR